MEKLIDKNSKEVKGKSSKSKFLNVNLPEGEEEAICSARVYPSNKFKL